MAVPERMFHACILWAHQLQVYGVGAPPQVVLPAQQSSLRNQQWIPPGKESCLCLASNRACQASNPATSASGSTMCLGILAWDRHLLLQAPCLNMLAWNRHLLLQAPCLGMLAWDRHLQRQDTSWVCARPLRSAAHSASLRPQSSACSYASGALHTVPH